MDPQEKITTAFWMQISMLGIPLGILLVMKVIAFLFRTFVSEERMNSWFKPATTVDEKDDNSTTKPKLTPGPYIEKPSSEMPYLPDNISSLIQVVVRKSEERGLSDTQGWLTSRHSFSFGKYNDPKFIGFGSLRILNEETIVPGGGYPQLVRQDYEILTIVIGGSIKHLDSLEHESIVPAGSSQVMTCGKGITHIEENASLHSDTHYLQLWLVPNFGDLKPTYQRRDFTGKLKRNQLVTIASPFTVVDKVPARNVTAEDLKRQELPGAEIISPSLHETVSDKNTSSVPADQDVFLDKITKSSSTLGLYSDTYLYQCSLEPGCIVQVPIKEGLKRKAYIHVPGPETSGLISVNYEHRLNPGDGAFVGSLNGVKSIDLKNIGTETCQFIFLDMA